MATTLHPAAGQPHCILPGPASELENALRGPEDLLQPRPDNLAQGSADFGVGKRCVIAACHVVKRAVAQVIFTEVRLRSVALPVARTVIYALAADRSLDERYFSSSGQQFLPAPFDRTSAPPSSGSQPSRPICNVI